MRPALVVGIACLAGACARSEKLAILAPPATVTILAATTRGPSETPGELFGGEPGASLTFAYHVIATPPNRPVGDVIMADRETDARPDQHFRITATRVPLAEKDMAAYVAAARRKRLAAIVFVHGFNNTYRSGLYRAAQITADVNAFEAPMFFSFASAGSLLNYWTDRGNAEKAAPAFTRFIEKASAQAGGQIDVGAHSMGAWMTVLALKDIADQRRAQSGPIIRSLILAAPDIDAEEFLTIWPQIRPLAANAILICNQDDVALSLSMTISRMGRRVGNLEDCEHEAPKRFPGLMVVDSRASDAETRDALRHNPAANPAVIAHFAAELRSRRMMIMGTQREIDTSRDRADR